MANKTPKQIVAEYLGVHQNSLRYTSGPDTGVGVDYYLEHIKSGVIFYVNRDQGEYGGVSSMGGCCKEEVGNTDCGHDNY